MKHAICLLALFAWAAHADTTNGPRTLLESLEVRTNVLIVKGVTEIGVVEAAAGSVAVIAKESTDTATGQKALGVALVVRGRERVQDTSYIDYDELDPLIKALAHFTATPWSQTSMQRVELSFSTRDRVRFTSANTRPSGGLDITVQSNHGGASTACLNPSQLMSLRNLIEHAKSRLDTIAVAQR